MQENCNLDEKFLSKQTIFSGRLVRLENWQIELPDGRQEPREIVCLRGASAVAAVDGSGNILLVRQYRSAVGRLTLELPAGKLDTAA